jgi:hypothetical protein
MKKPNWPSQDGVCLFHQLPQRSLLKWRHESGLRGKMDELRR